MGLQGAFSDPTAVLNSAINHEGNFGELKIFYNSAAAGASSTQGFSERYIWDKLFVWFVDINAINARPVL